MIDRNFKLLANIVNLHQHKLYIVGGAVRDRLLGIESNELDLVCDMNIDELSKIFSNVDLSFRKYGFIRVYFNNESYDISTLRKEEYNNGVRKPSNIIFVDTIEEDSYRRDFTINALYLDENEKIFDFHNGINDIKNKIIKSIKNFKVSYSEDPLRILRALRFKIQLDFEIEEKENEFIKNHLYLLNSLSNVLIDKEINKMKNISSDKFNFLVKEYNLDQYIIIDDFSKIKRKYISFLPIMDDNFFLIIKKFISLHYEILGVFVKDEYEYNYLKSQILKFQNYICLFDFRYDFRKAKEQNKLIIIPIFDSNYDNSCNEKIRYIDDINEDSVLEKVRNNMILIYTLKDYNIPNIILDNIEQFYLNINYDDNYLNKLLYIKKNQLLKKVQLSFDGNNIFQLDIEKITTQLLNNQFNIEEINKILYSNFTHLIKKIERGQK